MVVETEVQVIVMACNEQEAGKHKCERYWSEEHEVECQYGKYFVRLLKSREICPDFLVRTMRLRWTNEDQDKTEEERTVCQFHYSAWPDHGIPTQVRLSKTRELKKNEKSNFWNLKIFCTKLFLMNLLITGQTIIGNGTTDPGLSSLRNSTGFDPLLGRMRPDRHNLRHRLHLGTFTNWKVKQRFQPV